ncbi:hypothetical protein BJF79_03545 [Actinomadura sp. CNU-125]|nr:hypothetical protein BJF79_03545 [Actinomadura sp. CNU-125]
MDLLGAPLALTEAKDVPRIRREICRRAAAVLPHLGKIDDIELLASEAVTNAVLHGTGIIDVAVICGPDRFRVEVRDQGPANPGSDRRDYGRGLTIINALASRWSLQADEYGTCLWFEVDL